MYESLEVQISWYTNLIKFITRNLDYFTNHTVVEPQLVMFSYSKYYPLILKVPSLDLSMSQPQIFFRFFMNNWSYRYPGQ